MAPVLDVRDLVKDYPGVRAVDGISFAIEKGTCFGLLGPNGAGKTTTIEIVEGIQEATAGQILYNGAPPGRRFHEEIGIQFQSTNLLDKLSVRESLETFWRLYRRPRPLADVIRTCQLEEILARRNDRISGGQRQRLLLGMALINDPQLIFLDEPTTGLDPQARRHLWDIVEAIKAEGKTVILTTHYMEEAERLCDDLAIVDHGKVIARGSPEALLDRHRAETTIQLPAAGLPEDPQALLEELAGCRAAAHGNARPAGLELHTRDVNTCLAVLLRHGIDLTGIRVRSMNLEDLFLTLTGRRLRE